MTTERRALPSVGLVLERPALRALIERAPRTLVTDAIRAIIAEARADVNGGALLPLDDASWVREIESRIDKLLTNPSAFDPPGLTPEIAQAEGWTFGIV